MDRRSALQLLAASAAAGAIPTDLTAFGRTLHQRLRGSLRVLDAHQNATVVSLTDVILPATDTPGAKDAKVNEFIDLLLADWSEPDQREQFLTGLAAIDTRSHEMFGKDFVDGTPKDQAGLLTALDDEAAQWKERPWATRGPEPFYRRLKWVTLFGYFTSQVGAEQEDHYLIVPGRYDPCSPVPTSTRPE